MTQKDTAIVFDCGATNVRVIAIDREGRILASSSAANAPQPDPSDSSLLIWNIDEIWNGMCEASRQVISLIDITRIAGVTVTTFGVDGTLFDARGEMLYPVISWQCSRTVPVMQEIAKYIDLGELYSISGVYPFHFNTVFKLIWLLVNRPDLFRRACTFLFVPSVFSFFLTGNMINDTTMAGTSMLTDIRTRSWSQRIFDAIGVPSSLMTAPAEPGTVTGTVSSAAASLTGLPSGTPVIATGHDTQFALIGSGAGVNVPVLSSGTWEILMVRSPECSTGQEQMEASITTELDARPGLFNIGNQWIASGLIEWVRRKFYPACGSNVYEVMMHDAARAPRSCNGVTVTPDYSRTDLEGRIQGLTSRTTPGDICRATLQALAERLRQGREMIEKAGHFNASSIICVGGGARNRLWNQMRANASGMVIKVADISEATALGASAFVQYAAGNVQSPGEALFEKKIKTTNYYPGT